MKTALRIAVAASSLSLMLFALSLSSASRVLAASTPSVSLNVQSAAPRQVEDTTEKAVQRDYAAAWQTMTESLNKNRADLIPAAFVGAAADKLASTIQQQKQAGLRQEIIDNGHQVQAVFYSPEGSAMELHDAARLQIRVLDGDKVIHSETTTVHYVVVMTAAENSWKVRVLQAVPSF